jgi:putative ABC transport system permease protein
MFANVLAAALRNLARNRLYAAISIASLAVGMAAAILTGLYLRDELTFDRFIPGYGDVFVVISDFRSPGRVPLVTDVTPPNVAAALKVDFREIQAVARLAQDSAGVGRGGDVSAVETVGWVDPDFFKVLPLPVLAGDADEAMHRPDGVVITRAMARKVFGRDAPIGEILQLDRGVNLRVGAVLRDFPANTHLAQEIYASGLNAASLTHAVDARPLARGGYNLTGRTYVRMPTSAATRLNAELPVFFRRRFALADGKLVAGATASLSLVPLTGLHLYPLNGSTLTASKEQGNPAALTALGLIAALILAMAGVNFVNLMTARAARRAMEVGVRKAAGAARSHLIAQFIGESVIHGLIGLALAVTAVELALPSLRILLDRPLDFAYWRDPGVLSAALGMSLVVGVLAGVYPALVQSGFRPATVLKGDLSQTTGAATVRLALAVLQFALLIGLILAAVVIARQTHYALNEGLRVDKDQILLLRLSRPRRPAAASRPPLVQCRDALPDLVRSLPGVLGAACSSGLALDDGDISVPIILPGGAAVTAGVAMADYGFFELYGVRPLAGRLFQADHPGDLQPLDGPPPNPPKVAVINAGAARMLGYARPELAIGHTFRAAGYGEAPARARGASIEIIGVVPDVAFDLLHRGVRPMIYTLSPRAFDTLSIKLKGHDLPQTLSAIAQVWRRVVPGRPAQWRFMDQYLQTIYAGTLRQGYLIDALCGVAVFIACLGLFGLAAFTAEQRTKEIGVRKSMGASRGDIVRLLLWQSTRPALWANLIAWPAGWWAMDRWLHGFGRHIALEPWLFVAASTTALAIAWVTVFAHTVKVAGAKPVGALRYE